MNRHVPHYDPVAVVLERLQGIKQSGRDQWEARCPSHDDKTASLCVSRGDDGRVLLCCQAGCSFLEIASSLNMDPSEFFIPRQRDIHGHVEDGIKEIYEYHDASGALCLEVCRTVSGEPKFFQRAVIGTLRMSPRKAIEAGFSVGEPRLFRSARVDRGVLDDRWIFVCEGEKDALNAESMGVVATTNPGGAAKWDARYSEQLRDARVVIVPDHDKAGNKHRETVAKALLGIARVIKILDLPGLEQKGDFTDWRDAGGTLCLLKDLVRAAPEWQMPWSKSLKPRVHYGPAKAYFEFGRKCIHFVARKVDGEETWFEVPFAFDVWPMQRYRSVEDNEHGYRIIYLDSWGQKRVTLLPASATITKQAGRKACERLADEGVRLGATSDHEFAAAIGMWAQKTHPPTVSLVRTNGWHSDTVYVNGDQIFGAAGWYVDENSSAIQNRTGRKGTLEDWQAGVEKLATGKALLLAIAQSLAGALIEPLHLHPFILHLWVDSTQGKSTAAYLAAAIWGAPDATFKTWNTTAKSPEMLAEQAHGACLVLDDTSKFDLDAAAFAQTIHALCSPIGRSSLGTARKLNKQQRWRCSILSTGEISTRQQIGSHFQGGHRVRSLDMFCAEGTLAANKQHAESIAAFCYQQYGVVGDAWIQYLLQPGVMKDVQVDYKIIRRRAEEMAGPGAEEGRIASQLAVIATALWQAAKAKILPHVTEADVLALLKWAIDTTLTDEEADIDQQERVPSTPNERAYQSFMTMILTEPARFPESTHAANARDVIGYKVTTQEYDGNPPEVSIYTAEKMLKTSGLPDRMKIGIRRWVAWCIEQGVASRPDARNALPGGQRERWIVFPTKIEDNFTVPVATSRVVATSTTGSGRG